MSRINVDKVVMYDIFILSYYVVDDIIDVNTFTKE